MVSTTLLAAVLAVSGSSDVTLLQFTADWCGACQSVKPTVQRLTTAGFPIRTVNVDRDRELVNQFRVTSVPCFVLVAGGREIDRVAEAASYSRLVQMFERAGISATQPDSSVASNQPPTSAQAGNRNASAGLPRPLAALARNFGKRREPEEQIVQIEQGSAVPQPTTSIPSPTAIGSRVVSEPQQVAQAPPASNTTQPSPETNFHQQAMRSTVRLRIDDLNGHSVGTGTIIDTNQGEALIVTCGHVSRDSSGKGRIAVDLFADQQPQTVNGTLISYDLERDLGFVAIPATSRLTAAPVAPAGFRFESGQPVFSVGCDRGGDPSVRMSKITGIDRYVGPPNIEIAGQPVVGRSGGGLFSDRGQLIGVCNAADPTDNEGIFASLPAIHWELDRIGQRRIYGPTETQVAQPTSRMPEGPRPESQTFAAVGTQQAASVQPASGIQSGDDTEVICIVRSRANPQGSQQLLVLDRPSRDFLDRLANESRSRPFPGLTQQTPPRVLGPETFADRLGENQVIRAQSDR